MSVTQSKGASSTHVVATVGDADQNADTLSVTAASMTGSGVTLSTIAVSPSGSVSANVAAACGAVSSTFQLTVTDANGSSQTLFVRNGALDVLEKHDHQSR